MALAAMVVATVSGGALAAADPKPAEPAKTTSTTDRLKAKKKAPAASLERKVAETPATKPAARARPIVKAGS
jgi:hypothetical protein